jgi:hypothetical protein
MIQITVNQYFSKYKDQFENEIRPPIVENATVLIGKVNILLKHLQSEGIGLDLVPVKNLLVCFTSGWRPRAVNAVIPGAAKFSLHMSGEAIDLSDPDGMIDEWCMSNTRVLRELGLYMEHPSATKGWCHLQSRPPKSGRLIFYP